MADDANTAPIHDRRDREQAQMQNNKQPFPRYLPELETVGSDIKELLVKAGVPEDQLKPHIIRVEFDGAPASNLYGSDLSAGFIELGYELFLDKDKFGATFIPADIFDPNSNLKQLDGKIDIIQASSFFHLFDRNTQIELAKHVIALLKPQKGSLLFGRQVGRVEAGEVTAQSNPNRVLFRHNEATWAEMWAQIGKETGTEWETDSQLTSTRFTSPIKEQLEADGVRQHQFTVRRI
ncbi:MAG: hypothetical protein M1822_002879 [Bathelium mastoideum]|nr:MAG: hypothetical protein M1822_002879 [Bathelium mastoideum]